MKKNLAKKVKLIGCKVLRVHTRFSNDEKFLRGLKISKHKQFWSSKKFKASTRLKMFNLFNSIPKD